VPRERCGFDSWRLEEQFVFESENGEREKNRLHKMHSVSKYLRTAAAILTGTP
jgi:hypothetical protein